VIEISLIKDNINYHKEQLDEMEQSFARNFILHDASKIEPQTRSSNPEFRVLLRIIQGVLPEVLFVSIGKDLFETVSKKDFLNAFLKTHSKESPSLVFHFLGHFRSYEFSINSTNEDEIKNGSKKVVEEILKIIKAEKLPPESHDYRIFKFENREWKEIEL